jgi:hypothetical protein
MCCHNLATQQAVWVAVVVSRRSNHYRLTGRYGFFRRTIRHEFNLCRVRRHGWPAEGKAVLGHGWACHRRAQRGIFRVGQKPCSIVAEASLWKNTAKVGDDGVGEVHIGSDSPGLLCCVSAAALPILRCAARRDHFLPREHKVHRQRLPRAL